MKCPFLNEAQVKYCQASPFRKMIVQSQGVPSLERCSSQDHAGCPSARQAGLEESREPRCAFLQISLMQYCSAASVTKYIPYSESALSRCANEMHRYCDLYLGLAEPGRDSGEPASAADDETVTEKRSVEGIAVPPRLAYSPNHMWLDISEDGSWHAGVDAFFAHVIGRVDRLSFSAAKGTERPSAIIRTRGVDLQMIFPDPMPVTRTNDCLRAHPEKLVSHPYTMGWLFEGKIVVDHGATEDKQSSPLRRGKAALEWMRAEVDRVSRFVHERCTIPDAVGIGTMMDGGSVRAGLVQRLDDEEIVILFNEFFAFYAHWRR